MPFYGEVDVRFYSTLLDILKNTAMRQETRLRPFVLELQHPYQDVMELCLNSTDGGKSDVPGNKLVPVALSLPKIAHSLDWY